MANYSGGTLTICPFYQGEAVKSISCDVVEGVRKIKMSFNNSKEKAGWQEKSCYSYEYEIRCPIASALVMHAEREAAETALSVAESEG